MGLSRREFLKLLAIASAAGFNLPGCNGGNPPVISKDSIIPSNPYELTDFGQLTLMQIADVHAQLLPQYFREPSMTIGVGDARNRYPNLVGKAFLQHFGIRPGAREAYAFTHLDFVEAAHKYGKIGGFAHLATLVKSIREQRPGRCLLLDGGDSWQGSATALWTQGQDMVDACKLLGVDVMTGHWEFTYGAEFVLDRVKSGKLDPIKFVAQNIVDPDWEERVFDPYSMHELNGVKVAIIGQAFPYTPLLNPRYMVEQWRFGLRENELQSVVNEVRSKGAQVVVLLTHNGISIDLKMASRITGVDVFFGGHSHVETPRPSVVKNSGGETLVIHSGSNGKFLSVLDLDVAKGGGIRDYRYRLLPIFSNLIEADPVMAAHIEKVRAPFTSKLEEKLATCESLLYRRGNFTGPYDQLIMDALLAVRGADIAFTPGFRWGATMLPGEAITMDAIMNETAITYPKSVVTNMTGERIKMVMEQMADFQFNPDPYYHQGADMLRVAPLMYTIDPTKLIGQRISDLELNGKPINPGKTYKIALWASFVKQPDDLPDIWDVVAEHLRDIKTVNIKELNQPRIKGISRNNRGWATA